MPLNKSSSDAAFKQNVHTLMGEVGKSPHVKDRAQALAIAYATKRRAKGRDMGGFVNPAAAPVSGPPSMMAPPPVMPTIGAPQATPAAMPSVAPAPTLGPTQRAAGMSPAVSAGSKGALVSALQQAQQAVPPGGMGARMPYGFQGFAFGGVARNMGGQIKPPVQMPWFARAEAKGLGGMHTGPIQSIVPGRTDRHEMRVPSGSYVIPAQAVSHLGQSNTSAGMAVLSHMFGPSGPYGGSIPRMGRGSGLPKPPKSQGVMTDRGGGRGSHVGSPVEILAAGGEFVVDPSTVARIGRGSIEHGHRILDEFVKRVQKKHAKEIANLPPPAKA